MDVLGLLYIGCLRSVCGDEAGVVDVHRIAEVGVSMMRQVGRGGGCTRVTLNVNVRRLRMVAGRAAVVRELLAWQVVESVVNGCGKCWMCKWIGLAGTGVSEWGR